MHITKLQALGMKGRNFNHDLTPRVLICGANDRGKTARLAAIQLALLGYIPGTPDKRQNRAIMDFGAGSRLEVRATLDDGRTMEREYWIDGESVRSKSNTADPINLPTLDAASFFRMGPSGRLAYTFGLVRLPEQYTQAGIMAKVRNVVIAGESTEFHEQARAAVATEVSKVFECGHSINDAIAEATKEKGKLRQIIAYQKRRAEETIGFVRMATELRTREGDCSAETLRDIDADLARLRTLKTQADQRHGSLKTRNDRVAAQRARKQELSHEPGALPDYDTAIATRAVEANTLREKTFPALEQDADMLQRNLTETTQAAATLREQLKVAAKSKHDAEQAIGELQSLDCCPFCKSKGKAWKANLDKGYADQLKAAIADVARLAKASDLAAHTLTLATTALNAYRTQLRERDERDRVLRTVEANIRQLEGQKTTATNRRSILAAELAGLTIDEPPAPEEFEAIQDELIDLDEQITAAESRRTTAVELAQEIKRAAESAQEHDRAAALLEVAKATLDVLKATQAEMIEAGIRPVLDTANALFGGVLKSPLSFHEGEIGRWEGATFVKTLTFGGSEEALTFVAISAALSAGAEARIVLLDEFDRLDETRQLEVLAALDAAIEAGRLDQVIIASPRTPQADTEKWQLIDV